MAKKPGNVWSDDDMRNWLKAYESHREECFKIAVEIGDDRWEQVFEGRWPPQRNLAEAVSRLEQLLYAVTLEKPYMSEIENGLDNAWIKQVRDYVVDLDLQLLSLQLLLDDTRESLGKASEEWKETYSIYCGLRLMHIGTVHLWNQHAIDCPEPDAIALFAESVSEELVTLYNTWRTPLAVVIGKLAAAGNLGPPGEETRWSPAMKLQVMAQILGVSETTIVRRIKDGTKTIEKIRKSQYRVVIQSLTREQFERYQKRFPATAQEPRTK